MLVNKYIYICIYMFVNEKKYVCVRVSIYLELNIYMYLNTDIYGVYSHGNKMVVFDMKRNWNIAPSPASSKPAGLPRFCGCSFDTY